MIFDYVSVNSIIPLHIGYILVTNQASKCKEVLRKT